MPFMQLLISFLLHPDVPTQQHVTNKTLQRLYCEERKKKEKKAALNLNLPLIAEAQYSQLS